MIKKSIAATVPLSAWKEIHSFCKDRDITKQELIVNAVWAYIKESKRKDHNGRCR